MSYTKYRSNLNPDTATEDQLTQNNDRLIEYLDGVGEDVAADQVDKLRERANAAKEALVQKDDTIFKKKILKVSTEIKDVLTKIKENQIDEQDTSIKATAAKAEAQQESAKKLKKTKRTKKEDAKSEKSGGLDATDLLAAGAGAKLASKALNFARSPAFVATAAVGASGLYIGSEVAKRQAQSEKGGTEAERSEAEAAQGAGLAGAAIGAAAGAKAMGTAGAIIGTMGFPGVGTLIGGASGVVTGGAAGAALGYYMGDKVGEYISNMWAGPLERLPDEQRSNPFTLHEYLTKGLIPELTKTVSMEKDPEKIEKIQKGIGEYTQLSKDVLGNQKIDEWMSDKLKKNGLDNADFKIKRKYLATIMEQFKETGYYEVGNSRINIVAPEPRKATKGLANAATQSRSTAAQAQQEKALAEATAVEKFNAGNTLGKEGSSLTLSRDGKENYDILVRNGILSDDWGKNSIKKGGEEKLKQMPLSVLKSILKDGYMDESSTKIIQKLIADKQQQESTSQGMTNSTAAPMATTETKAVTGSVVNNTPTSGEGAIKGKKSLYDTSSTSAVVPYKMAGMEGKISGDEEIKAMIKRHEGVKNKPYKDSLGLWTVGVGHLIGDGKSLPREMNREFSDEEINQMFEEDYAAHKRYAEQIPGYGMLNKTGQGALTDLTFNMGGKWYKRWPSFTQNISEGNTEGAAQSLEKSRWYSQVGRRAPEIVAMVRAGAKNDKGTKTNAAPSTMADASKQKGSGVVGGPDGKQQVDDKGVVKGRELASNETNVPEKVAVSSEANKKPKETKTFETAQTLASNTKQYEKGGQQSGSLNNININNSKNEQVAEKQPRLLSVFS